MPGLGQFTVDDPPSKYAMKNSGLTLLVVGIAVHLIHCKEFTEWGQSEGTEGFAIGGDQVSNPELYPWHVAIFTQGTYVGGGSLISDSFVLTAAHVIHDISTGKIKSPKTISIKAGIVKLGDASAKVFNVSEIFAYPKYDAKTMANDICLLKLSTKAKFGASVRPIYLWDEADEDVSTMIAKKYDGTVVGWGLIEGGEMTNDLNRVKMKFIDEETCNQRVPAFKKNGLLKQDMNYCASRNDQTVCRGDSGGGMFIYDDKREAYYLRGLVSQGKTQGDGCKVNIPVLFTDIAYYLKWIERIALPKCYNLLGHAECPPFGIDQNQKPLSVVNLRYKFRRNLLISDCHGVLISKKHVLVQASCVESNPLRELNSVSIGNTAISDYFGASIQYEIEFVKTKNDLSIITLKTEVSQPISPICLPTAFEKGQSEIFYWSRKSSHPKKLEQLNIPNNSIKRQNKIFEVKIPGNQIRLGGTPFLYEISDEHMFLRGLEKCPWKGCRAKDAKAEFVDVLHYGKWIREVVGGAKGKNDEELLPPRCA